MPHASGVFEFGELGSGALERVNYRPRQITGAAAEWFEAAGQEAGIAGPFCAALKLARPRRLIIPGSKSGHIAAVLRQTDSRPRTALLQSFVGVNQDYARMIKGLRSTHLSRCPRTAGLICLVSVDPPLATVRLTAVADSAAGRWRPENGSL